MVQETIAAVQEAEKKAEKLVSQAETEGRELLSSARKEAEKKKERFKEETRLRLDSVRKTAWSESEAALQQAVREAEKEIALMKEKAEQKSAEAVRLIADEFI